ncbi:MAG: LysR family transcriptional regulator [Faecalibacterium sp.]|jgi:DNA-binding transcriptional LysR family regulator|nr:LysR family transcriptional regulator [Faecalibacterium sp.]
MEIRQLTYFTAVVEEGTVTGAAKRLNMTQPPLTAQLHALESELGCRLFAHEGRRLRLTEAGHAFYQRAHTILGLCDAAEGEMSEYRQGTAGTLRLGVVSSVSSTVFLAWLGRFSAQYPAVRYDLSAGNTYQLLTQLGAGQIDIALARTPFSAPELTVLPLRREAMLAVGQPAFFAGLGAQKLSVAALAETPLILYRRWESVLRSRFEAAGCTPRVFCRNEDAQTTLALAQKGFGVGILPASAVPEQAQNGLAVREIDDAGLATEIAAVCRAEKLLPQCARLFWQSLRGEKSGV